MKSHRRIFLIIALAAVFFAVIAVVPGIHRLVAPVRAQAPRIVVTYQCAVNTSASPAFYVAAASTTAASITLPANGTDCGTGLASLYSQGLKLQSFGTAGLVVAPFVLDIWVLVKD